MVEFVDLSVMDLVRASQFIHLIKPSFQDKLVCGIEKAQPFDQSVVFHLTTRDPNPDEKETANTIFLLSAEYMIEHPFWKEATNE